MVWDFSNDISSAFTFYTFGRGVAVSVDYQLLIVPASSLFSTNEVSC